MIDDNDSLESILAEFRQYSETDGQQKKPSSEPAPAIRPAPEPRTAQVYAASAPAEIPEKSHPAAQKEKQQKHTEPEENDEYDEYDEVQKKGTGRHIISGIIGKLLSFILMTLLAVVAVAFGLIYVIEKGPSPTFTGTFCRSVRETSAIRWISNIYLSDEELSAYVTEKTENVVTDTVNTSLIRVADSEERQKKGESLQLIDISAGNCKGKLLIVSDPTRVILGTSEAFGTQPGLLLTDMVAKYDAIAGTNAGGFNDESGQGDGGRPQGLVIVESEIIWGEAPVTYNVVGLDADGVLIVGTMTGNEALAQGMKWGVSFVTHDGQASSLIINGEVQNQNLGSGVNPRTAIGQRADGALLLLVLDGRSINTLGATMEDVVDIMLEYGAVNAGNLDGGSSSVMVYGDEIINHCASITGPRRIPTGFLVLKDGEENG